VQMIKFENTRYKSGVRDMSLVLFGIIYLLVSAIWWRSHECLQEGVGVEIVVCYNDGPVKFTWVCFMFHGD